MKYILISCDDLLVIIYSLINLNDFAICTFATVTKMLVSCLTDNKTLKNIHFMSQATISPIIWMQIDLYLIKLHIILTIVCNSCK